jgi:hypothetical protein
LILKIFAPKNYIVKCFFLQNLNYNIVFFKEKSHFFPPKIAENCDHNINQRVLSYFCAKIPTFIYII